MRGQEKLRLIIPGQPKGAGSKTAEPLGKRGHEVRDAEGRLVLKYRHATKGTAEWMDLVEGVARRAWKEMATLDGPLWVAIDCYEKRPGGHFYADGRLRPDAPMYPHSTTTHDSGKLRRAIEDAITNAQVWADDKRVVNGGDEKFYCDTPYPECEEVYTEPCAVIRVGAMDYATVGEAVEAGVMAPVAPPGQAALV